MIKTMNVYLRNEKYPIKQYEVFCSKKDELMFVVTTIDRKRDNIILHNCDFGFEIENKQALFDKYLRINLIDCK